MSVIARYINRLDEMQSQLVAAETEYQSALGKVREIQQAEGVGQLMYVPAGGSPIHLAVPQAAYKPMLDELTKASVNSAVLRIAGLWEAVGALAAEVGDYIANAEAKAGVVATQPPDMTGFADAGLTVMCDNTAVESATKIAATQEVTVPLPPRVRRIPGG